MVSIGPWSNSAAEQRPGHDHQQYERCSLKALFAVLAGAVCLFASCQLWASAPTKRVLIIFPYESNFPGFFHFDNTLRSSLRASQACQFNFYSESMDLLRFPGEPYFDRLVYLYQEKYAGRNMDLIIAVWRPSLDFLRIAKAHRQQAVTAGLPKVCLSIHMKIAC